MKKKKHTSKAKPPADKAPPRKSDDSYYFGSLKQHKLTDIPVYAPLIKF